MWIADLPDALSKLPRSVLPSMATTCPEVISCSAVIQFSRHFSNSAVECREDGVEAVVRRDPTAEVEDRGQPVPLLTPPGGDRDEVIGPGDDGADGDRDDVVERVNDLTPAWVGEAGEMILKASRVQ